MKNLDRIYGLSKSQILLDELTSKANIDYFNRSQTNQLLSQYKEKKNNWNEADSEYIVRIAIFVTSKAKHTAADLTSLISISSILKELPSVHEFMLKLKDFINVVSLDPRVKADLQSIISSYAFALTLYNKYEELWNNLALKSDEELFLVKKIGWGIFLLSRVNLIQRRSEIVECACMLVATIYLVLMHCDIGSFEKFKRDETDTLSTLTGMIKGQAEQIRISATHLKRMLEIFIQHRIVQSETGVGGIFQKTHIKFNCEKLTVEYVHKLLPSEFDQTKFIESFNEEFSFRSSNKFVLKSCLHYEFQPISLNSALIELELKPKVYNEMQNDDCELWVAAYADENIKKRLGFSLDSLFEIEKVNAVVNNRGLFENLIVKLIEDFNSSSSENTQRACVVLALEIFKAMNSHKSVLSLDENISFCESTPFETWKAFNIFTRQELPKVLYLHIKELEILVLASIVWQDKKFLNQYKGFISSKKELQTENKAFLQEMVFYSMFAIKEICSFLNISERLQEEIWTIFKSSIITESEILLNRNLHQVLICSIYGLCKAKNLNVTFNSIISKMTEIDPLSESLFRKMQIEESTGDIIKYYNEEYLKYMKSYLLAVARNGPKEVYANPLGISNSAFEPVGNSYSAQSANVFSPYFTPSTRRMYEFGESPIESLNSFNNLISRNNRNYLSFDEEKVGQPIKRPKLVDEIFQGEDIVENLPEEFPGFKED